MIQVRYSLFMENFVRLCYIPNSNIIYGNMFRGEEYSVNTHLDVSTFYKIVKLFEEKEWDIDDELDNPNSLFNRFCFMFSLLESNEQELIYNLTKEEYRWIRFHEYPILISHLIKKLKLYKYKKIYLTPLVRECDIGKIKSSSMLFYLFKSTKAIYLKENLDFIFIDGINKLCCYENKINEYNKAALLLIDDFIGSGKTAINCTDYIERTTKINKDKIIVSSLVAQAEGIKKIENNGYKTLITKTRYKGISENISLNQDKEHYLQIMKEIGEKVGAGHDFKLGFNQSEALISLVRTPNNTFPIFWLEKQNRLAPFPRRYG